MTDRYTIEQAEDGDWLIFDNKAFYCCYSGSSEQDAFAELNRLNTRNQNKALGETLTASIEVNKDLHKRIAELEHDKEVLTGTYNQLFKAYQELEKERDECAIVISNLVKSKDVDLSGICSTADKALVIRDLEQQAKGVEDALNDSMHDVKSTQVYVADLDERVAELRNQAKALRGE